MAEARTDVSVTSPRQASGTDALRYVPALDGVRAIAVLSVMAFHFGQGWLPGGYLGVDVFFVLSGFLITTILVQHAPTPFSARTFWIRRARRLFPALAVMLAAVFVYGLTTGPLEQSAIRGQGIASIFYVNNWWLLLHGSEYFQALQQASPLLHTWTLSVEEQWYLILPLILLVLISLRRFTLGRLLVLTSAGAVLSFAWTVALVVGGAGENRIYLGTDTRAQQLLLGALLAVLGVRALQRGQSRTGFARGQAWLGVVGLGGLLVAFASWPEGKWVGVQLPVAALLSAGLILGAATPGTWVARTLSWEPLRLVGLISYGLYLWHWPITVILDEERTNAPTPVRFLFTFALATASYRFVERPIRRGAGDLRWFLVLPVALTSMALVCTPRADEASFGTGLPEHAAVPFSGTGPTVFVIGDSVAGSLWDPLRDFPRQDVAVSGSLLLGCPILNLRIVPGVSDEVAPTPAGVDCVAWQAQWRQDAARMRPQVGMFVGSSSLLLDVQDERGARQPFASEGYQAVVRRALDETLPDLRTDRIVIATNPCSALPPNQMNDQKNNLDRARWMRSFLAEYAADHGYGLVDLTTPTCQSDTASFYFDGLHFTTDEALRMWDRIVPVIRRATGPGAPE